MSEGEPTGEIYQPSFEEKLRDLTTPRSEGEPSVISDPRLRAIAREAGQPWNKDKLDKLLEKGSDLFLENPGLEEEWSILAPVLFEEAEKRRGVIAAQAAAPQELSKVVEAAEQVSDVTKTATAEVRKAGERMVGIEEFADMPTAPINTPAKPTDKEKEEIEEQRVYVRKVLEKIEDSGRDSKFREISPIVIGIEGAMERMNESVAKEVKARLVLHDSSILVNQAAGLVAEIANKATELEKDRKKNIDAETIRILLKEGLPGLEIAAAWDLLQKANFDYFTLVSELNASMDRNFGTDGLIQVDKTSGCAESLGRKRFFTDTDYSRRRAVESFLVQKLMTEKGIGRKEAERSLMLAGALTVAALENSIFNTTASTGRDELAEAINFNNWRLNRQNAGRERGPLVTMGHIDHIGTSWLRTITRSPSDKDVNKTPLYAAEIDPDKITAATDWVPYATVTTNRYRSLAKLFLERRPKSEYDKTFLFENKILFDTADEPKRPQDKGGPLQLRMLWALGVVDVALATPKLGWTDDDFVDFETILSVESLSKETGTFLNEGQWSYIAKKTKLGTKRAKKTLFDAVKSILSRRK